MESNMRLEKCELCKTVSVQPNVIGIVHLHLFVVGFSSQICNRCAELLLAFFEKIVDTLYVTREETLEANVKYVENGMRSHGQESPLLTPPSSSVEELLKDIFGKDKERGENP